jgi:hypothetical protein
MNNNLSSKGNRRILAAQIFTLGSVNRSLNALFIIIFIISAFAEVSNSETSSTLRGDLHQAPCDMHSYKSWSNKRRGTGA